MSSDDSSDDQFGNENVSGLAQFLQQFLSQMRDGEGGDSDSTTVDSDDWSTDDSWSTVDSGAEKTDANNDDTGECVDELKSSCSDDRSLWLKAIKTFVEETHANSLDLSDRQMKKDEVTSLFKSLSKSQVTEINFYGNNFKNRVKHFSKSLVGTKLQKLNFTHCRLTNDDLLNLMAAIKDSEITDLNLTFNNIQFDESLTSKFVDLLCQSRLTQLNIMMNSVTNKAGVNLARSLPSTSLTHLNLRGLMMGGKFITSLISNLPHSAITDLNLFGNNVSFAQLKQLSKVLKDSKLEKLNLYGNEIKDAGVNVLAEGLVNSKITDLDLSTNEIKGRNNLGLCLKHTQIKSLDLSQNEIKYDEMFNFPDFLKGSSVSVLMLNECYLRDRIGRQVMESLKSTEMTELYFGYNDLKTASILEFCESVKFTNISEVHFASNSLSLEALSKLGDCLKESKLKTISLFETFRSLNADCLAKFIENTKGSSLTSLDLSSITIKFDSTVTKSLENTTFTHFDISDCSLSSSDISNLGAALKSTAITHLELRNNSIGDKTLEMLAECLKGTQVVSLDLSDNSINNGVKALADALKDTNLLNLTLKGNKIEDDGLCHLAGKISSSFVTVVDAGTEYGSRESLIALDRALWENKKIVQQLIDAFKKIVPEADDSNFRFDSSDNSSLLNDSLLLYNTILKRPSAVNVLAQEKPTSLSTSQITTLMLNEFPSQFVRFISQSVKVEVAEHVDFLKRCDELGLNNITELLLSNRSLYVIDKDEDILHPFVCKLMYKFKQPIVNLGAEEKLIRYFTNHKELEGALDVVNLLRQNACTAAPKDQN